MLMNVHTQIFTERIKCFNCKNEKPARKHCRTCNKTGSIEIKKQFSEMAVTDGGLR